jgi:hypothetical protein
MHIARKLMDEELQHKQTAEFFSKQANIQRHGEQLANVIGEHINLEDIQL